MYLYRAVDRDGQTIDFMLSERRDMPAARRFFKQAIGANGVPERVVIDKSGANLAGLEKVNASKLETRKNPLNLRPEAATFAFRSLFRLDRCDPARISMNLGRLIL